MDRPAAPDGPAAADHREAVPDGAAEDHREAAPEEGPRGRIIVVLREDPRADPPAAVREAAPDGRIPAADRPEAAPGSRFPIRALMWTTGMIRTAAGRIGNGRDDTDQKDALQLRPFL